MAKPSCDQYRLLTRTMYANRLVGDARGFVSNIRFGPGPQVRHNIPGTPFDRNIARLEKHVRERMKGSSVRIELAHAEALLNQFQETSGIRIWFLMAVSIKLQRIHLVVGVPGERSDVSPSSSEVKKSDTGEE